MAKPFIMVAPNGARRGKADHPALPISTPEIVATAVACQHAGANGFHLHIRDETGRHSLDAGRYLEAMSELNTAAPGLRIQITTESAGRYDAAAQLSCLEQVRPDWASISIREVMQTPNLADRIYGTCADNGTEVQHILYDVDDIAMLQDAHSKGVVRADQNGVIYVLGRYATGQAADPSDLIAFIDADEGRENWMVCAFGPNEHKCLIAAASLGGDLRVGFENSICGANGVAHVDNAASVASLKRQLQECPA